eukprot:sb/3468855/
MDVVNYGGALREQGSLAPTIQMNWNIKKFLPEDGSLQKFFQLIIAGYIQAVNKSLTVSLEEHVPGETPIRRASQKTELHDHSTLKEFVHEKLQGQLFGIVQRVHSSMPSGVLGDRNVFPDLPVDDEHISYCLVPPTRSIRTNKWGSETNGVWRRHTDLVPIAIDQLVFSSNSFIPFRFSSRTKVPLSRIHQVCLQGSQPGSHHSGPGSQTKERPAEVGICRGVLRSSYLQGSLSLVCTTGGDLQQV